MVDIKWIGANSANFQKGRSGKTIKKVVLHWIVGKLSAADATFQNPNRIASAHYGIGNREVHQYVKEEDTAYHAGNLTVNYESIGIEHEGGPDIPISEDTIKTSIDLVTDICRRYSIPADRNHIFKHSEFKATQCPGTLDIDRIVREVNARLNVASGPTDTISVPKKDFERMVMEGTKGKEVFSRLGFDIATNSSDKVIDAVEKDRRSIAKKSSEIEALKSEGETLRRDLAEALSKVCPSPSAHTTNVGGNGDTTSNSSNNNTGTTIGTVPETPSVPPEEIQTSSFVGTLVNFLKKLFK